MAPFCDFLHLSTFVLLYFCVSICFLTFFCKFVHFLRVHVRFCDTNFREPNLENSANHYSSTKQKERHAMKVNFSEDDITD